MKMSGYRVARPSGRDVDKITNHCIECRWYTSKYGRCHTYVPGGTTRAKEIEWYTKRHVYGQFATEIRKAVGDFCPSFKKRSIIFSPEIRKAVGDFCPSFKKRSIIFSPLFLFIFIILSWCAIIVGMVSCD